MTTLYLFQNTHLNGTIATSLQHKLFKSLDEAKLFADPEGNFEWKKETCYNETYHFYVSVNTGFAYVYKIYPLEIDFKDESGQ